MATAAELIRQARITNGLTQAELARHAGVTQSVVSAYENGRREPAFATVQRLVQSAGCSFEISIVARAPVPFLDTLHDRAPELRKRLERLGATDIRVFGSVARGDETDASDVDLLVDLAPNIGMFALLRMQSEAESILGRPVDIVPISGLKPDSAERIIREAVSV